MKIGDQYNPFKMFYGCFVPNWLLQRTEISQGAKLCFSRLCQYAGETGNCFPLIETLAAELGVKVRMVKNYLAELRNFKLIESKKRGLGESNCYIFLWHEWSEPLPPRRAIDCPTEVQHTARQEVQHTAHIIESNKREPNKRININKEEVQREESYSPEFEQLWSSYPHPIDRGSKPRTYKNWNNLLKSGVDVNALVSAAMNYKTYCNAKQNSYRYKCSNFYGEAKYYETFILLNISNLSGEINNEATQRDIKQSAAQRGSQIISNYFAKRRAGYRGET